MLRPRDLIAGIQAALAVLVLAASGACSKGPEVPPTTTRQPVPRPRFPSSAILIEPEGKGRLALLGIDVEPEQPLRGRTATITEHFRVLAPCTLDHTVFVHARVPGDEPVVVGETRPDRGVAPTSKWALDEIVSVSHVVEIPSDLLADHLELLAGLHRGGEAFTVEVATDKADELQRVIVGQLPIGGAPPKLDLPELVVRRAGGKIAADGVLNEKAWAAAEVIPLSRSRGAGAPRYGTKLRMLWDDQNLYVAFESEDQDVTDVFTKRDDPIFQHESVSLFLMPGKVAPDVGPYLELDVTPGGAIHDVTFTGRRSGADLAHDALLAVGTKIDGTLNKSDDLDRAWISEWVLPWKGVPPLGESPKEGDEWRMNAYRMEKWDLRAAGSGAQEPLKGAEGSAWSPPRTGDFHNTVRFGRLRFGPK